MTKLYICTCPLLLFFFKIAAAQSPDTLLYSQSIYATINKFDIGIGNQARLYNGYIYKGYDQSISGNAFLDDVTRWTAGSVDYDGETFENVPMNYDVYADQLIVQFANNLPCALVKNKVFGFVIRNIHFVQVLANYNIKAGYYEEIYGGRSQVLNKLEKYVKSDMKQSNVERYFMSVEDYQQYFIKKDDKYFKISSVSDVLSVFKDKKKEMKLFMKSRGIQPDGSFVYNVTLLAKYYDSLGR